MLKNILKLLKTDHYLKNLVVFVPILFSMNFANMKLCLYAFLMFIAFCFISSSVYILNDLVDIENDRKHPIKRYRPIAGGKISIRLAIFILLILFFASSLISLYINAYCLFSILAYFILNIFYTFLLKHIVLIDALCIAMGFILRILAGCFAILVLPSPLVILMTFFLSNFFTFTKRKLELNLINNNSIRKSLKELKISTINQFILINAALSISFYITYVLDHNTIEKVGSEYLYLTTIPFTLIMYRLFMLVDISDNNDDPIIYIKKDKILKLLFLFYLLVFILIFFL